MSEKLTDFENSQVGLICGVLEVTMLQSLNYFKNAQQQQLPLTMNPRVLYRGYTAAVINMGGCTMVQVATMGRVKKAILGDEERDLTDAEQFGGGFFAGVTSALVGGPVELTMIQQQRTGQSLLSTIGGLLNPNIVRGIVPTAVREGLWSMGYLAVPPVIGGAIRKNFPEQFDTADKARVPSAFLGAFLVCYASHPFDTAKTCMQGDIEQVWLRVCLCVCVFVCVRICGCACVCARCMSTANSSLTGDNGVSSGVCELNDGRL